MIQGVHSVILRRASLLHLRHLIDRLMREKQSERACSVAASSTDVSEIIMQNAAGLALQNNSAAWLIFTGDYRAFLRWGISSRTSSTEMLGPEEA